MEIILLTALALLGAGTAFLLKNSLYKVTILFIYICILLPAGVFMNFPIKYALYVVVLGFTVTQLAIVKDKIKIGIPHLVLFFTSLFFIFVGSVVGILNSHPLDKIFNDFSGFILLLLVLPITQLVIANGIDFRKIIHHFVTASSITAIMALLMFIAITFFKFDFNFFNNYLFSLNLGVIAPVEGKPYLRYFFRSDFYCMLAFIFCLISLLREKDKKDYFATLAGLIINGFALYISYTRGLFIGVALAILTYIFIEVINPKKYNLPPRKLIYSALAGIMSLSILVLTFLSINVSDKFNPLAKFFGDWGTSVKIEQIINCINIWQNSPLFGYGLGLAFTDVDVRGGTVYNIELTFFEYLAKTGAFGILLLFVLFAFPMLTLIKRIHSSKLTPNETHTPAILFYGYIGMLAAGATNPYTMSSLGMLYLVLIYAMVCIGEIFTNKEASNGAD